MRIRHGCRPSAAWPSPPGADVIPAFIAGTNTKWFHAAGRIHASLRTALLARELLHLRGQEVSVRLGPPLAAGNLVAHDAIDRDPMYSRCR